MIMGTVLNRLNVLKAVQAVQNVQVVQTVQVALSPSARSVPFQDFFTRPEENALALF